MKSKRIACIAMAGLMAASLAGCGGSDSDNKDTAEATKATTEAAGSDSADDTTADAEGIKSYADIQLGTDFTDLSAEIKFYNNRTDMDSDDYGGKNWKQYLEDFNKEYPNIKVDVITDTNYRSLIWLHHHELWYRCYLNLHIHSVHGEYISIS